MTFDEALHLLATWVGRTVVISVQPQGRDRYVVNLSGQVRPRTDVSMAEEDRSPGEAFFFALTDDRLPTGFYLDRNEFRDATTHDNGQALVVDVRGATLVVEAAKRIP